MGGVELVALYWTVSGPVEVHIGREWSLFDFRDRCAQAQRVGFAGLGIWHADLQHQLETRSLADIKTIMDDHGLTRLELEFLGDWFLDPGDERRRESDLLRAQLWEAAAALGAHHVKVGNIPGHPCPLETVAERFAELCADAAQHHDSLIAYELIPFDVNVQTLDDLIAVVSGAGANGVAALDTWHLSKLAISPDALRAIPDGKLGWVELSDGQFENMEDRIDEVVNHRRLPGEGEFDIPAYVNACIGLGYPGPWGVEVLSEDLRNRPIDEIFDKAYATTSAQFHAGAAA
jgi:sugar phosphate isomerase/epimerase